MLIGLLLPFILITDISPFLRFGMFAEPVKKDMPVEHFMVKCQDESILEASKLGFSESNFYYLLRNYYYRDELIQFAGKLFQANQHLREVTIYRIEYNTKTLTGDTVSLGTFKR